MNLTDDQKLALAQRISAQFTEWVNEELTYQIEEMKDDDELSYEYYANPADSRDVMDIVTDLIVVTAWELSTNPTQDHNPVYIKRVKHTTAMRNTNTVRIFDVLGLFPESKDSFRYITVKTFAHAEEIMLEQIKLGNQAVIMNW